MFTSYTTTNYSVLDQVLVDLAPLKTGNWVKRHLHHADNTLEIAGFKERIQGALNVLQVWVPFYSCDRFIAQFNNPQLEIVVATGCTVNDIRQAQIIIREAQIVGKVCDVRICRQPDSNFYSGTRHPSSRTGKDDHERGDRSGREFQIVHLVAPFSTSDPSHSRRITVRTCFRRETRP